MFVEIIGSSWFMLILLYHLENVILYVWSIALLVSNIWISRFIAAYHPRVALENDKYRLPWCIMQIINSITSFPFCIIQHYLLRTASIT